MEVANSALEYKLNKICLLLNRDATRFAVSCERAGTNPGPNSVNLLISQHLKMSTCHSPTKSSLCIIKTHRFL